jgi:hypothetical protein
LSAPANPFVAMSWNMTYIHMKHIIRISKQRNDEHI